MATGAKVIILRTAWVYAGARQEFCRTMLNAARKTSTLKVVADQRGTPTAAPDLANAILDIVARAGAHRLARRTIAGIYHATGMPARATWHGFAEPHLRRSRAASACRRRKCADRHRRLADARPSARRIRGSSNGKLQRVFGVRLPPWERAVGPIVRELLQAGGGR